MTFSQVENVHDAVVTLSTSHISRLHGLAHSEWVGENGLALVANDPAPSRAIGACWGADRLDLPRVGVRLDSELLRPAPTERASCQRE